MNYTLTLFVHHFTSFTAMMIVPMKTTWTLTHKINLLNIHTTKLSIDASLEIITLYRQDYYLTAQYSNNKTKMGSESIIGKYISIFVCVIFLFRNRRRFCVIFRFLNWRHDYATNEIKSLVQKQVLIQVPIQELMTTQKNQHLKHTLHC
jgi:hypothetical protein